jgi:hypothetical protein
VSTSGASASNAPESAPRRLVDRIAHNDLVDALPYVDAYDNQLKAHVEAVVRAEMSTFQPSSDYLTPLLASSADSAFIRP